MISYSVCHHLQTVASIRSLLCCHSYTCNNHAQLKPLLFEVMLELFKVTDAPFMMWPWIECFYCWKQDSFLRAAWWSWGETWGLASAIADCYNLEMHVPGSCRCAMHSVVLTSKVVNPFSLWCLWWLAPTERYQSSAFTSMFCPLSKSTMMCLPILLCM